MLGRRTERSRQGDDEGLGTLRDARGGVRDGGAHAARAKVHSLSRTKAKRKSAALLAWDAALKMARLSARNTASNREVVVM